MTTDSRTTTQRLAALGYTHRKPTGPGPRKIYSQEVVNASGAVVFVGNWEDVNAWLEPQEREAAYRDWAGFNGTGWEGGP